MVRQRKVKYMHKDDYLLRRRYQYLRDQPQKPKVAGFAKVGKSVIYAGGNPQHQAWSETIDWLQHQKYNREDGYFSPAQGTAAYRMAKEHQQNLLTHWGFEKSRHANEHLDSRVGGDYQAKGVGLYVTRNSDNQRHRDSEIQHGTFDNPHPGNFTPSHTPIANDLRRQHEKQTTTDVGRRRAATVFPHINIHDSLKYYHNRIGRNFRETDAKGNVKEWVDKAAPDHINTYDRGRDVFTRFTDPNYFNDKLSDPKPRNIIEEQKKEKKRSKDEN